MSGARTAGALLAIAAASFFAASAIHFGLIVHLGSVTIADPFAGAAPPEAILGAITLAAGADLLLQSRPLVGASLVAALFAVAVTLYGLSITARGGRIADVVYHLGVLAVLATACALLARARFGSVDRVSDEEGLGDQAPVTRVKGGTGGEGNPRNAG